MAEQEAITSTPKETCFARASILHALFSVEAAANCCLDRLQLAKGEFEKIERKKPLDQFAFLYEKGFGQKFDKGIRVTQSMGELITLRNSFAHPRTTQPEVIEIPIEMTMTADGKISGLFQNMETEPERTQFLTIPWSPRLLAPLVRWPRRRTAANPP